MEKNLKLLSLNKEYPDIEVKFTVIKDIKAYVEEKLKKGAETLRAQKTVLVKATRGEVGQEVDTRPHCERDGKSYAFDETKSKVKVEGSMIVHNPDGEDYIVKPDKFDGKYRATAQKGVYEPIGDVIVGLRIDEDITFLAPWGSDIFAPKGSVLNITNLNDIYSITNLAFEKTYTPALKETVGL